MVGPDSAVGIATRYGLDGPRIQSQLGEIFRTCPDWPWGPPSLLYNGYRVSFPGIKRPRRGTDHPPPPSAEVKERVEPYLYSTSGPSWPDIGWTLPSFPFYFILHECQHFDLNFSTQEAEWWISNKIIFTEVILTLVLFSFHTGSETGTTVIISNSLHICQKMFLFTTLKRVKDNHHKPAYFLHITCSCINNISALHNKIKGSSHSYSSPLITQQLFMSL
jgi:hypothetical protein